MEWLSHVWSRVFSRHLICHLIGLAVNGIASSPVWLINFGPYIKNYSQNTVKAWVTLYSNTWCLPNQSRALICGSPLTYNITTRPTPLLHVYHHQQRKSANRPGDHVSQRSNGQRSYDRQSSNQRPRQAEYIFPTISKFFVFAVDSGDIRGDPW